MIAPSHGVIWRRNLATILEAYGDWVVCRPSPKVLVVYDTMWESTAMMAQAIVDGVQEAGAMVKLHYIRANDYTQLATETLDAATIAFGSPTLNGTLLPAAGGALAYLKGLRPLCKAGFAFGSYGWSKGGAKAVNDALEEMKFEILREPLETQYRPTAQVLDECRAAGRLLARKANELSCQAREGA